MHDDDSDYDPRGASPPPKRRRTTRAAAKKATAAVTAHAEAAPDVDSAAGAAAAASAAEHDARPLAPFAVLPENVLSAERAALLADPAVSARPRRRRAARQDPAHGAGIGQISPAPELRAGESSPSHDDNHEDHDEDEHGDGDLTAAHAIDGDVLATVDSAPDYWNPTADLPDADQDLDDALADAAARASTSWWRFYPHALDAPSTEKLDGLARERITSDSHSSTTSSSSSSTPAFVPNGVRMPETDTNLLFLTSYQVTTCRRPPMPAGTVAGGSRKARCALTVARIKPVLTKSLRVRRPVIGDDDRYVYNGPNDLAYETVTYHMPETDPRVVAGRWDQITAGDFLALELADPYSSRIVNATPGAAFEHVVDGIVTEPPLGLERTLAAELQWTFAEDAVYINDSDTSNDSTATRFAKGQPVPLAGTDLKTLEWVDWWSSHHDQYYTLTLRTVPGLRYDPADERNALPAMAARSVQGAGSMHYDLAVYVHVGALRDAIIRGEEVPLLGHFLFRAAPAIRATLLANQPKLYVPTTVSAGDDEAEVPTTVRARLDSDQKRTLAWLVRHERDRAARTVCVRKLPPTTNVDDTTQWAQFGARDLPVAVQIGRNGPYFNLYTRQLALKDHWAKTRPPLTRVEVRAAIDLINGDPSKTAHLPSLALVAANPFRSVRDIPWAHPRDRDRYLVSRATLVVVPADRVTGWIRDAQRVLSATAKIVKLTSSLEYTSLKWNDVLLADVIVVALPFLQNRSYRDRVRAVVGTARYFPPSLQLDARTDYSYYGYYDDIDRYMGGAVRSPFRDSEVSDKDDSPFAFVARTDRHMYALIRQGRESFGMTRNAVIFDRVHFHRIVVDGIKDLESSFAQTHDAAGMYRARHASRYDEQVGTVVRGLRASHWVGVSYSPITNSANAALAVARAMGAAKDVPDSREAAQWLLTTCMRRHTTASAAPTCRIVRVNLTPAERALTASIPTLAVDDQVHLVNVAHHATDLIPPATDLPPPPPDTAPPAAIAAWVESTRAATAARYAREAHDAQVSLAAALCTLHALLAAYPAVATALPAAGVTLDGDVVRVHGRAALAAVGDVPVRVPARTAIATATPRTDAVRAARGVAHGVRTWVDAERKRCEVEREVTVAKTVEKVASGGDVECAACAQRVEGDQVGIAPCAHVLCDTCADVAEDRGECSVCRAPVIDDRITRVPVGAGEPTEPDLLQFGAKARAVAAYLERIHATAAAHDEDPPMTVLVSQFPSLTAQLSRALKVADVDWQYVRFSTPESAPTLQLPKGRVVQHGCPPPPTWFQYLPYAIIGAFGMFIAGFGFYGYLLNRALKTRLRDDEARLCPEASGKYDPEKAYEWLTAKATGKVNVSSNMGVGEQYPEQAPASSTTTLLGIRVDGDIDQCGKLVVATVQCKPFKGGLFERITSIQFADADNESRQLKVDFAGAVPHDPVVEAAVERGIATLNQAITANRIFSPWIYMIPFYASWAVLIWFIKGPGGPDGKQWQPIKTPWAVMFKTWALLGVGLVLAALALVVVGAYFEDRFIPRVREALVELNKPDKHGLTWTMTLMVSRPELPPANDADAFSAPPGAMSAATLYSPPGALTASFSGFAPDYSAYSPSYPPPAAAYPPPSSTNPAYSGPSYPPAGGPAYPAYGPSYPRIDVLVPR
ncbi:hypothetical protein GGF32_004227 [Allomyces javanicus]|nr:hypothetical protein GGF32_004227 [Allomyces javanicus]